MRPPKTPYKDVSAAVYDQKTPKGKIDASMKAGDERQVMKLLGSLCQVAVGLIKWHIN